MTRMIGPGCAVMCNSIDARAHTHTHTGPDCGVMCNLMNTHTHTHTHTHTSAHPLKVSRAPSTEKRARGGVSAQGVAIVVLLRSFVPR